MFAFSSSLAEPIWLLLFGVVFLAVATAIQMRLTKKQRAASAELDLLSAEPEPLPTTLPSR